MHWMNRVFKVMKPKRCCKSNKEDKKELIAENRRDSIEQESNFAPLASPLATFSSPKKSREAKTLPQVDQPLPMLPVLPFFPSEHDLQTPPALNLQDPRSPPHLEQRNSHDYGVKVGLRDNHHLSLPMLPSNEMDEDRFSSGSHFRLNPRLNWNTHSISRQLNSTEQTLSSLLNANDFPEADPPSPLAVAKRDTATFSPADMESVVTSKRDIVKPIPRYGTVTVGSNATTIDCDNTTYLNSIAEESCCAWFDPSWTSAFDFTNPHDGQKSNAN